MVTYNNNVNRNESCGCGSGCGTVVGIVLFVVFMWGLGFIDYKSARKRNESTPPKEKISNIDTCAMIKDSVCVYKAR